MTVKRALGLLISDDLIIKYREKKNFLYRANNESNAFKFLKISYNISMIEEYHRVDDRTG